MSAYYRLLDDKGLQEAAEANLTNAQTVRQAAEARLANGLATLPDVLEARSAEAQADYDLQAAIGATEIAHGDLATALGVSPTVQFQGRKYSRPSRCRTTSPTRSRRSIDKALAQRPDLMQRVAELRAADAEVKFSAASLRPQVELRRQCAVRSARTACRNNCRESIRQRCRPWDARLTLTLDIVRRLGAGEPPGQGACRSETSASVCRRGSRPGGEPGVGCVLDCAHGASSAEGGRRAAGSCDRVLQCGAGVV